MCVFMFHMMILKCTLPSIFQISSMIEIEVEMDSDVLAAEAASNAVRQTPLFLCFPPWSLNILLNY